MVAEISGLQGKVFGFSLSFHISKLKLRQQIYFKIGLDLHLDLIIRTLEAMDYM